MLVNAQLKQGSMGEKGPETDPRGNFMNYIVESKFGTETLNFKNMVY